MELSLQDPISECNFGSQSPTFAVYGYATDSLAKYFIIYAFKNCRGMSKNPARIRTVPSDLFGLDWTGFEDRSSAVLWKPDLDRGAPVYPLNLIW